MSVHPNYKKIPPKFDLSYIDIEFSESEATLAKENKSSQGRYFNWYIKFWRNSEAMEKPVRNLDEITNLMSDWVKLGRTADE